LSFFFKEREEGLVADIGVLITVEDVSDVVEEFDSS